MSHTRLPLGARRLSFINGAKILRTESSFAGSSGTPDYACFLLAMTTWQMFKDIFEDRVSYLCQFFQQLQNSSVSSSPLLYFLLTRESSSQPALATPGQAGLAPRSRLCPRLSSFTHSFIHTFILEAGSSLSLSWVPGT